MEELFRLSNIDLTVIIIYFIAMMALGIGLSRKSEGAGDYFLAGRSMTWGVIGFSLFASNISSTTLIGLAGDAYATGISVFNYEWMAAAVLVFFAVFMLPSVLNSGVYTMPEYLERRYNHVVRTYFAIITLFLNIVVETAASLYAGGLIAAMIFPEMEMWQIIAILAVLAGGYTVMGGLSAVMITDVIQAVLLLLASVVLTVIAFDKVGGIGAVFEAVPDAKLSLVRPLDDPGVPWLGLITGVPLLGFYFWCTNQFMVQRVLSAKDIQHGRNGVLLAGLLKLSVLFIMVLPGTAAILLYPNLERPDLVYPTMVFDLLPVGLTGLVIAGFLAALMSQIDSTLNSASTLVTMDFVRRYKPELSNRQLMKVGRMTTLIIMVLAVLWAPLIKEFGSLFKYLQTVFAYTVPPIVAMFLIGMFWSRANTGGAMAALIVGVIGGIALFIVNVTDIWSIHFLYVVTILAAISAVALVVGSLASPPPSAAQLDGFVWSVTDYREETKILAQLPWYKNYRVLGTLLLLLTALMLVAFW